MRKGLIATLAGILTFGTINAQTPPGNNEDIILLRRRAAAINNEISQEIISPLEKISSYDILPIIYAIENNSQNVVGTKIYNHSSADLANLAYTTNTKKNEATLIALSTSVNTPNNYAGFDLTDDNFPGTINVILTEKTVKLVGNANNKGVEITFSQDGTISGFYDKLKASGKVVEYDSNKLPKKIFLQIGQNVYVQTTTYDNKIITGHEAKLIEGSSLDKLVENYK